MQADRQTGTERGDADTQTDRARERGDAGRQTDIAIER